MAEPTNWTPNRKPVAGFVGAAAITIVVWFARMRGVEIPGDVTAALTGLISFGMSYFVPEGP